jgi:hypothetical protein
MSADGIRAAAASGDYVLAAARFESYAKTLPPTAETLAELRELLRWTALTVLCDRAHAEDLLQEQRDHARVLAAYVRQPK